MCLLFFPTNDRIVVFLGLKYLEKSQGQYDSLKRLIGGLDQMLPFVESVRGRAKEKVLIDIILMLLYLIEDVSIFVINYLSDTNTGMHPGHHICLRCSLLLWA